MSNRSFELAGVSCLLLSLAVGASAHALCGDVSGDGYVRASDALATLKLAVATGYDAAGDVTGGAPGDGKLTATDARQVLVHAAAGTVPMCAAASERRTIVTTASCDFVTGGVAEIDLATRTVVRHVAGKTEADAVVRRSGGRVFVLNRFGASTVVELDVASELGLAWECSVGSRANPHDIVIVSPDRGYVTRYDSTKLAIIDPAAGPDGCAGFLTGTIDLAPWADEDGFPEMDQMLLIGDRLYVSIQRLDRDSFFRPAANGALVVIDVTTDTVVDVIELTISNPFAETKGLLYDARAGLIYVAGPGFLFSDLEDGGVEIVDPAAGTSRGVVATGAGVGGDLTDFALVGSDRGYALVADDRFGVSLVEVDLVAGEAVATLAASDLLMSDIEITEAGELWLADRNCFGPGLRVFSLADGGELTAEPIRPPLAPFNLVFSP